MNPFERARQTAIEVRAALLKGRAHRPIAARDILATIESELGLAIESVDPGFHALGGSSAVLKRDEKFIYISNAVDPDKHAALAAHELGHWFLDADKTPTTLADLRSVAGTARSQAIVTVESYGARERQELQANVFAREFLAPRDLVRALYAQGLGPVRVADDLGIPLEYIRQQMLDALLLPQSPPTGNKVLHPASDDQRAAARAEERFANVVAGPGTGKTSTLIHRVKFLLEDKHVDPTHILVVTFTNKAAFELVERLKCAGIPRAADIWAGTFHAFGLEFLRKYHQRFDLDPDLNVADRLNSMTMLSAALPGIPLKHFLRVQDPYDWLPTVVQAIGRLKEELVSPAQYRARLPALPADSDEIRLRREDVATLYEAHEAFLAKAKMVDFVDLVAKPAMAIREDRAAYSELADKFQYILIDEYQDVTRAMIELMKQLARKKNSLWVVGDVRQAIHHWRGASVHSLMRFDATFKDEAAGAKIQRYPLACNRRSSAEVLALIEEAGREHRLEASLPLDKMTAIAGKSGIAPVVMTAGVRAAIPAAVHEGIISCHKQRVRYGDQAVLCRQSAARESLAAFLAARGIPVLFVGDLVRRPEIKQLLCLMQLLTERQPKALVGLTEVPGLAMSREDIAVLLAAAAELRWQRGRWLHDPPPGISTRGLVVIAALRTLLAGQTRHANPWDFVCELLLERRFAIPNSVDVSIPAWIVRIALWQFAYSVRNADGEMKEARLPRFLMRQRLRQRIGETYAERELPPEAAVLDAVRILTIHGSKGLEYEAVHIPHVNDGQFGPYKKPWHGTDGVLDLVPPEVLGSNSAEYDFEQAVERNNLFYVAVSRAQKHLWLYEEDEFGSDERTTQLRHYPQRFITRRFDSPSIPVTPVSSSVMAAVPRPPISFERFEVYARCARQYGYRYEWKLRREEETDPALRARWAIMAALREIAAGGQEAPAAYLRTAWLKHLLPEAEIDPTLWADAMLVFERGLTRVNAFCRAGGVFAEPPTSIAGLALTLPWGFNLIERYVTTFHILRFTKQGLGETAKFLGPALSGMEGAGTRAMTLHALVPEVSMAVKPSKMILKTDAAKAAIRFQEGNRDAQPGSPCARCAFVTICPLVPVPAPPF